MCSHRTLLDSQITETLKNKYNRIRINFRNKEPKQIKIYIIIRTAQEKVVYTDSLPDAYGFTIHMKNETGFYSLHTEGILSKKVFGTAPNQELVWSVVKCVEYW
jgi:hypothetical protein